MIHQLHIGIANADGRANILLLADYIVRSNVLELFLFEDVIHGMLRAVVGQADAAEEVLHSLGHCHFIQLLVQLHGERSTVGRV
jgi:hypothetical protein